MVSSGVHHLADDRVVPPPLPSLHLPIKSCLALSGFGIPFGVKFSQLSSINLSVPTGTCTSIVDTILCLSYIGPRLSIRKISFPLLGVRTDAMYVL
jgi:hypothetical protein